MSGLITRLASVRIGSKFTLCNNGMRYKHVGYSGNRIRVKCIGHQVNPMLCALDKITLAPNHKVKLDN